MIVHWVTLDNQTPSKIICKITFDNLKKAFLAEKWKSFHLSWKNLDHVHL